MGKIINPASQTVNIPVNDLKDRVCKCGGEIFATAVTLKEVPAIYSPSGIAESMIIPVGFFCIKCGNVISTRPESIDKEKKSDLVEG